MLNSLSWRVFPFVCRIVRQNPRKFRLNEGLRSVIFRQRVVTPQIAGANFSSRASMESYGFVFREHGDPGSVLSMEQITLEEMKPTSVYVKVKGSSINPSDIAYLRGIYAIKPDLSTEGYAVPGFEGALEVKKVGSEVTKFSPGDLVILLKGSSFKHGSYTMNGIVFIDPNN